MPLIGALDPEAVKAGRNIYHPDVMHSAGVNLKRLKTSEPFFRDGVIWVHLGLPASEGVTGGAGTFRPANSLGQIKVEDTDPYDYI